MSDIATQLLQRYLVNLATKPVQTKALTSGFLNGLAELLASYLAGAKDPKTNSYYSTRVPKMALYGFLVSGPLSHVLTGALQNAFKGKTGVKNKLLQIIVSMLTITPITCAVFIASMAVVAGAKTVRDIKATLQTALWPTVKASWVSAPVVLALCQAFVPEMLWVPVFSVFGFVLGTYNNMLVKRKRQQERLKKE